MIESGFYATELAELLAVFGGKIEVCGAVVEEDGQVVRELAFKELDEEHVIGEELNGAPTLEEYNQFSPIRLRFYDTKSIDVIINQLEALKQPLGNGK